MGDGVTQNGANARFGRQFRRTGHRQNQTMAALDLGTNNCRLLIAVPRGRGFRVVDAFSKIVRLGEGLGQSGELSQDAMERAIEALKQCAKKIRTRNVRFGRYIATQACRAASNGDEFLARVKAETGLEFEVISTAEEARLAVEGCTDLFDENAKAGLVFDIGGGSTELSWVTPVFENDKGQPLKSMALKIDAWLSIPLGVVSLSEEWGGRDMTPDTYLQMRELIREKVREFGDPAGIRNHFENGDAHLLGTSGTVTSLAGVHLALPHYRRDKVDGLWLAVGDARDVISRLIEMDFVQRSQQPCIGQDRADLVVCGCAILDALLHEWPVSRIRVADRGLREGLLNGLSIKASSTRRRRKRSRSGKKRDS